MNDFDYKSLTKSELEHVFSEYTFEQLPMWHQLVSLAFAGERSRVAFFHSAGTGKTLTSLYARKIWNIKKLLVVCPTSAFGSWERDCNMLGLSFDFVVGSKKQRLAILAQDMDVYVINYEGLKSIYAALQKENDFSTKKSWKIQHMSFVHKFDCVILDEVHKCKNHSSIQSGICSELSRRATNVIGLTGTPIDKGMLELFNIMRVIDRGQSLGIDFFAYRDRYFHKVGFDYELKSPSHEQVILDCIETSTLSFAREECFELPEIHEIVRPIRPTQEFLDLQKALIEGKALEIGDVKRFIPQQSSTLAHRLRELPNGFFYHTPPKENPNDPNEERQPRETHYLRHSPKVEAVVDIADNDPSKKLVFYKSQAERYLYEKAFLRKRIKFESIHGEQTDRRERPRVLNRFRTIPEIQILLCQMSCANEGFDAFEADTVIFTRPVTSPKMRSQCIARIYRKGQVHKCLVVELAMDKSIDQRLLIDRKGRFNFVATAMQYIRDFHREVGNG